MELEILYWFQSWHTPVLDRLMLFITSLADHGLLWIVLGVVMLCRKNDRKTGINLLLSLLLSLLVGNIFLKNIIMRPRPCWIDPSVPMLLPAPLDYSFPSAHTMHSFAAAFSVFFHHKKAGIIFLIVASLIAFSRMYLFVHFPTDIAGGLIIGTLDAYLIYKSVQKFCRKKSIGKKTE